MEKLDFLIDYLLQENKQIKVEKIPRDIEDKKKLWRSLCNIRDAKQISDEYIKIEKEYLQEELKNKYITKIEDIKPVFNSKKKSNLQNKIYLWKGDITTLKVEAIVNAANVNGLRLFYSLP